MPDGTPNRTINNVTGGVLDPLVRSRIDLPIYQKGLEVAENFIINPQGGASFRPGTRHVKYTRKNKIGTFIPFQFSDSQAYLIEVTDQYFRFYKDNGPILEGEKTITGATKANPAVITSVGHGYATGDEVFITGIVGMTELNNEYYYITKLTNDTFSLQDVFGNNINSSAFTTYGSGGSVSRVYEIQAPWTEDHIFNIHYAQTADIMYLVNQNYAPRKLSRTSHIAWTLAKYTRTADPFAPTSKTITAITKASPGVVTSASHGFTEGAIVIIDSVVGMTEVNDRVFVATNVTTNTFELYDLFGAVVDTSGYTTYGSAGTIYATDKYPRAISFTGAGRLVYGGTRGLPSTLFSSKAPTTGTTAYEDHTTGTNATDALVFTLSPEFNGKVDTIRWITNTSKTLAVGCYGNIRRIYGATEAEAITPTSFNAKSINSYGCAATLPVSNGSNLFYIQRANQKVRSVEYDIQVEGYTTIDRNLVAGHVTRVGIEQIVEQQGSPDLIWGRKTDGKIATLTFKDREDISGWSTHSIAGQHVNSNGVTKQWGKVLSLGVMPRATEGDQIWMIVERVINGNTVRTVEFVTDMVNFPDPIEFYTGADNKASDLEKYEDAKYELQKDSVFLDMSSSYDGSDYGRDAGATLTPGATSGTGVTFTASANVFDSSMVGRELWKIYDSNGDGGGKAVIKTYVSPTEVTCDIRSAFDSVAAVPAGNWLITTGSLGGLKYLEGENLSVIADGGPEPVTASDKTVTDGVITLDTQASKVHVGYKYRGMVGLLNLDPGSQVGSAQSKPRNIKHVDITFLNSVGAKFGPDPYNLSRVVFSSTKQKLNRPSPLFTGTKRIVGLKDSWLEEQRTKKVYVVQEVPAPCNILAIDVAMVVNNE